jgi:hypothetical protein
MNLYLYISTLTCKAFGKSGLFSLCLCWNYSNNSTYVNVSTIVWQYKNCITVYMLIFICIWLWLCTKHINTNTHFVTKMINNFHASHANQSGSWWIMYMYVFCVYVCAVCAQFIAQAIRKCTIYITDQKFITIFLISCHVVLLAIHNHDKAHFSVSTHTHTTHYILLYTGVNVKNENESVWKMNK